MRKILATWGVANIGWAALSLMAMDNAGIPDGYISAYDRLTSPIQAAIAFAILLAGIFILARSIFGRTGRWDVAIGLMAVFLLYLPGMVIEQCPRWTLCAATLHDVTGQYFDDGIGG